MASNCRVVLVRRLSWALFVCSNIAVATSKEKSFRNTEPQPPSPTAYDELARVRPGTEVPFQPERIVWAITATPYGKKLGSGEAPIYSFDQSGRRTEIGKLAAETEIKLDEMQTYGRNIYYAIPHPNPSRSRPDKRAWVNGHFIKAVRYK